MERATRGRPSPNDNLGRSESAIQEAAFKVASGVGLRSRADLHGAPDRVLAPQRAACDTCPVSGGPATGNDPLVSARMPAELIAEVENWAPRAADRDPLRRALECGLRNVLRQRCEQLGGDRDHGLRSHAGAHRSRCGGDRRSDRAAHR